MQSAFLILFSILLNLTLNLQAQNFRLHENGVTVICDDAEIGESGEVNGVTYIKRTRDQINKNNASTSCSSGITDMSDMFKDSAIEQKWVSHSVKHFDVSAVTDMSSMFEDAYLFNQDLSFWDVSNVTNMSRMFYDADFFNGAIEGWDISSVTDISQMFGSTSSFNRDLSNWDVSNVTNMNGLFYHARKFNQDISTWDVSNVRDMRYLFSGAQSFDHAIGSWNVSRVQKMDFMFFDAVEFHQDLSQWDVSNVESMNYMFYKASNFNGNLSNWCVNRIEYEPVKFADQSSLNRYQLPVWGLCGISDSTNYINDKFQLAENSITVICDEAQLGEKAFVDHRLLTKRSKEQITPENASTSCISGVVDMSYMFYGSYIQSADISHWDVSSVENMDNMFERAIAFNSDISAWDVSNVNSMEAMFKDASEFNQDLVNWCVTNISNEPTNFVTNAALDPYNSPRWGKCGIKDITDDELNEDFYLGENGVTVVCSEAETGEQGLVNGRVFTKRSKDQITVENASLSCTSGISDMSDLFFRKDHFNKNISHWDVSSVTNMSSMFEAEFDTDSRFNQDLSAWDVSNVTDMSELFVNAAKFNQDIGGWDVSKVTNMSGMFLRARSFNQDISNWNVSNVQNMDLMFNTAELFNQPIGVWNVSKVESMNGMFRGTKYFNQPIGNWDVSSVQHMEGMFFGSSFNQFIGNWNVSNVRSMRFMFVFTGFNQPIGQWDVSNVRDMYGMFEFASFNQDLSNWCVSQFSSMPSRFVNDQSSLSQENMPKWGTCPDISIEDPDEAVLPDQVELFQNYPNPFNALTIIQYDLETEARVQLDIYSINGKLIKTLVTQTQQTGRYTINFNAENLPSGIYLYRLKVDGLIKTRKMLLIK